MEEREPQGYMDRAAAEAVEQLVAELEDRLKSPIAAAIANGIEEVGLEGTIYDMREFVQGELSTVRGLGQSVSDATTKIDLVLDVGARAEQIEGIRAQVLDALEINTREIKGLALQVSSLNNALEDTEARITQRVDRVQAGIALLLREVALTQRAVKVILDTLRAFTAPGQAGGV